MENYIAFAEETKPTFIDFTPLNFLDLNFSLIKSGGSKLWFWDKFSG